MRYQLFCVKREEIESFQLPPCRDSLQKHIQRANYQAAVWKSSIKHDAIIPSPAGKGWKIEKIDETDVLVIDWMDGEPAPKAVLDLIACNCTRLCKANKCERIKNGLKCTDMCKLAECDNQFPENADSLDIDESDDSEDDY